MNQEIDHGLKTDATLAELRHAEPHDERDLACLVGGVWWTISTVTLLLGSLLFPDLIESGSGWWQVFGTVWGLVVASSLFTWVRRLPERACYVTLSAITVSAVATNVILMLAAPGGVAALSLHMLASVMYAAYFLGGRVTLVIASLVTMASILPLVFHVDESSAAHMTSRLTVWVPVLWLVAGSILLQNSDRRAAIGLAERQAMIDRLTGLDNLRALRARTASALAAAGGRPTGLLLIDIDDLKEINASHGHRAGDRVLVAVAEALLSVSGPNHHVARISGDVFAVLVTNAVAADMEPLAARYRAAVQSARQSVGVAGGRLDAGVGTAIAPDDGSTLEDLMTVADRALYDTKRRRQRGVETAAALPGDLAAGRPPERRREPQPKVVDPEEPVLLGRPLHAFTALGGWLMAIILMLLSLAMPDADRSHINQALPIFLAAFVPATYVFFFPPPLGSARHMVNDMMTLSMIALVMAVTGGIESPAIALVFVYMIYEGWFLSPRQLVPRAALTVLVLLLPLTYDELASGAERVSQITTIYMAVNIAIWQALAMGFNRLYILRAQEIADRLARLDPLTGLANRESFERALEEELEGRRYVGEDSLAVVMLDLAGFKRINSIRGHGAGDHLLCEIADSLRVTMRSGDLLARIGGDEFAAIVPSAGESETRALAERLVSAVDDCIAISPDASASRISTCAGFSLFPTHGRTADDLMSAADLALLTVKTGGRGSRVSRLVVGL